MEIEVTDTRENPMMEREEYFLEIKHQKESTPSREKIIDKFSAQNDEDPLKIELGSINTAYGNGYSTTKLKVYEEQVREENEEEEKQPEEEEEE